jgi:hypothetical protein
MSAQGTDRNREDHPEWLSCSRMGFHMSQKPQKASEEEAQAEKEEQTDHHPVRRFGARADPVQRTERLRGMTSRTPNLPGVETQRGNEHVGKAVKREGMYRDAPQVLYARLNLNWLNPSSQQCWSRLSHHTWGDIIASRVIAGGTRYPLCDEHLAMNQGKGTKRGPTRTTRHTSVNTGSPTRGDSHGDGVPIVAKCSG